MKNKKRSVNLLEIILGLILVAYCVAILFMLAWAIMNSLKSGLAFDIDCNAFPKKSTDWAVDNYSIAFKAVKKTAKINGKEYFIYLPEMFWNTILYSVGNAFFATATPFVVAYVTAKYKFRFNKVIYGIVIFVMVTPIVGSTPSQLQMAKTLGFYDSHVGFWFMSMTFLGTGYLIFYSTFKGLSWEYAEAAFIDGASHSSVMLHVMFPLVKNTFAVMFLLSFIGRWNDYQTSWLFLPSRPTAALGVQNFSMTRDNKYAGVPIQLAASMWLMLPVTVLFVAFRDKLVGNLTVGGIKG